ncbi:hypothetical protein STEG23_000561, partial [Scotinomys teguina]
DMTAHTKSSTLEDCDSTASLDYMDGEVQIDKDQQTGKVVQMHKKKYVIYTEWLQQEKGHEQATKINKRKELTSAQIWLRLESGFLGPLPEKIVPESRSIIDTPRNCKQDVKSFKIMREVLGSKPGSSQFHSRQFTI